MSGLKRLALFGVILLVLACLALVILPLVIPPSPLTNLKPRAELTDSDSRFAQVNGLDVHYKESGSGEPTLILLHGFGASLFSWREVLAPLAQSSRVIAYDRPAFGLTDRPMPGEWQAVNPYSTRGNLELLMGLMDSLGVEKAVLVGNSAGGTLAVQAAMQYPQRVEALILVNPALQGGGSPLNRFRAFFDTPQMEFIGIQGARAIQTQGEDLITAAWHDPEKITESVREGYRKPLQLDNWDRALWEFTKASEPQDLSGALSQLEMPVLLLAGDDDRIIPTAQTIAAADQAKNVQLKIFTACGHVPQEECPQPFLQAVDAFILALRNAR